MAGYDVVAEPQEVRVRIGVALQEAALDDLQTGRELLALQGRLFGLRANADRAAGWTTSSAWSTSATPSTGGSAPTRAA